MLSCAPFFRAGGLGEGFPLNIIEEGFLFSIATRAS
jgi:hypothetical protein